MALQDPTPLRVVRTLADHARDIRALSTESATGPLRASVALVAILNDWPRWQHEAGGLIGEAWCKKTFGSRGYANAARVRAEAVDSAIALGFSRQSVLTKFHHQTLVYIFGTIPSAERHDAMSAVLRALRSSDVPVLPHGAAQVAIRNALGKPKAKRVKTDDGADAKEKLAIAMTHIAAMYAAAERGETLPTMPERLTE